MNKNSRRMFLKNVICGTLSASLATKAQLFGNEKTHRIKKGQMFYRRLGRTNLNISEISLGSSPLPDWTVLLEIIERGVNYIDTSHTYMNGNSERQIGTLLKNVGRDKIYVATKFHARENSSEESIIKSVEGSLQRLKTDHIDVLLIHGAEEKYITDERVLNAFEKLKKEGKYRFQGISCHSNHHEVVKKAVECGRYDMIQLGYNVFDIQKTEKEIKTYDDYLGASGIRHLLSLARSKDIGIIAMKTLKIGGKRQNLERYKTGDISIFQAMLKWVLENRNVSSVVTEMLTFKQMEEDLAVVNQPFLQKEKRSLLCYVAENSKDYCHLCGLCESSCPLNIKTTSILRYLAYYESYWKIDYAKKAYSSLDPSATAASCTECGQCENVCPYGVNIRKRIQEAHFLLG